MHIYYYLDAPSIEDIEYTDLINAYNDTLGMIEFSTRFSPPTSVTWLRDGTPVTVDGYNYEMEHIVTDRLYQNTYYYNVLFIRDAVGLAGYHTYTCTVTNYAGTTSRSIRFSGSTTLVLESINHNHQFCILFRTLLS